MFGFKFIKFQPTEYVLKYKNGKITKEGKGLSFNYFVPTSSLVMIPIGSSDSPFIFQEVTSDYQSVTIQGQVSFKVSEPKKIAEVLNFTLDRGGKIYTSEDPVKLKQKIVNIVQVLTKKIIQKLSLRESLKANDILVKELTGELELHPELKSLGIQILGISILSIKPNTETLRALEAEARELILKEADDAIYIRRNASVEQERKIRENELNTEIAVENKKREIKETQMKADKVVQEKTHALKQSEMKFQISQEEEKLQLVNLSVKNAKEESDSKAYAISATMKAFEGVDPSVIKALASTGMQPEQLIALAFQGLADNAEKIGQLNITPELLQDLMNKKNA